MTRWLVLACLLSPQLFAAAEDYQENGWWMNQPYDSIDDFNYKVEYTDSQILKCDDDRLDGIAYQFEYWVRPDLVVMKKGDNTTFKTLDGTAGWRVLNDGNMEVFVVQEEHFGFYHCVVYAAPDYYVIKKGVNYKGAYFGDMWDIYRLNVIIGCSAAAGFLAACIAIFVVHHFFFDHGHDEDKYGDETSSLNSVVASGEDRYDSLKKNKDKNAYENETYGEKNGGFSVDPEDEDVTPL